MTDIMEDPSVLPNRVIVPHNPTAHLLFAV